MDSNMRYQKLGLLQEKKTRLEVLRKKIERVRQSVELGMYPRSNYDPLDGVDIESVEGAFRDWKKAADEYKKIVTDIMDLEADLGIN